VYDTLDQSIPHEVQQLKFQPKRDLFFWPLGLALALLTLYHALPALRSIRRSRPVSDSSEVA
jgi:Ca-activated chloride channel family protein